MAGATCGDGHKVLVQQTHHLPKTNDLIASRRFSTEEKARILTEADACTGRGELGELLRREGIYSSHLNAWRKRRQAR